MSKKWLFVGGIGLIVLVILAGSVFLTRPKGTVCERLIRSAIDNKPGESYGLLSPEVQNSVSKEDWKNIIEGWYSKYATSNTTFELTGRDVFDESSETVQAAREVYTITTATGIYRGSCYLDKQEKIAGYSNEIDTSKIGQ